MILKVFSVYDVKAEAYLQPFFMTSKGQAVRGFTDLLNDGQSQFSKHPGDFTLFELGSFDDSNGFFTSNTVPIPIGCGNEFLNNK